MIVTAMNATLRRTKTLATAGSASGQTRRSLP